MPFKPGETPKGAKPFEPGQSGNPSGRPRKLPKIDDLLAEVLGDDENSGEAKAILEALVKRAKLKGGDKAAEILLDRAFGKPKQTIEQKTEITGSMSFNGIQVIKPDEPTATEVHTLPNP